MELTANKSCGHTITSMCSQVLKVTLSAKTSVLSFSPLVLNEPIFHKAISLCGKLLYN